MSEIKLQLDGMDERGVHRLREHIDIMFENGVFMLRNGKAILNFDHEGTLQEIAFDYKKWKRKKLD